MKSSAAASTVNVEVIIDTLVVEGPWQVDGNRLAETLSAQLGAALREQQLHGHLSTQDLTLVQLDGGVIRPSAQPTSAGLGTEIASALVHSLDRTTELGKTVQESPWKSG